MRAKFLSIGLCAFVAVALPSTSFAQTMPKFADVQSCVQQRAESDIQAFSSAINGLWDPVTENALRNGQVFDELTAKVLAHCKSTHKWPRNLDSVARPWFQADIIANFAGSAGVVNDPAMFRLIDQYVAAGGQKLWTALTNAEIMSENAPHQNLVAGLRAAGVRFKDEAQAGWTVNALHFMAVARTYENDITVFLQKPKDPVFPFDEPLLWKFEGSRPVFQARSLTTAERAELKILAKNYATSVLHQTLESLQRLLQLGETGDREAMIAARDALAQGIPSQMRDGEYFAAKLPTGKASDYFSMLAALWTAHIWDRHGYEDAGRKAISTCISGMHRGVTSNGGKGKLRDEPGVWAIVEDGMVQVTTMGTPYDFGPTNGDPTNNCGFTLLAQPAYAKPYINRPSVRQTAPAKGALVEYYSIYGEYRGNARRYKTRDFYITGARFYPVVGDDAFNKDKFERYLQDTRNARFRDYKKNELAPKTFYRIYEDEWFQFFANRIGRDSAIAAARSAGMNLLGYDQARLRQVAIDSYHSAKAAYERNPNDKTWMDWSVAANVAGGDFPKEFARLAPRQTYVASTPANVSSSMMPNAGQSVEVRSYDSSGNYTGSTRESAVWAEIMRASAPPPR